MNKLKIILAITLIITGVVGRFILVSYVGIPNFEIITALALVSGIYLGGIYTVIVPLSIIFLSDMAIGNNYIFIFTWTAFALVGVFGVLYRNKFSNKKTCHSRAGGNPVSTVEYNLKDSIILTLLSSVFFYLYTNFGWWLMSGMYEYNFSGLIDCYIMAIPFFKNQLLGNLIFVPMAISLGSYVAKSREFERAGTLNEKVKFKNNHF